MKKIKLHDYLIKEVLLQHNKQGKIVVAFPGRYQPFSIHHKKVYDNLKKKFDIVYMLTSNKVEFPNSPFTFDEKVKIMISLGISKNDIKLIDQTYSPFVKGTHELTKYWKKFLTPKDSLILVVGKKDSERLSSKYYDVYEEGKNLLPVTDKLYLYIDNSHYMINNPVSGKKEKISGTYVRNLFNSDVYTEKQRKIIFDKLYKEELYSLFNEKLGKNNLITEMTHVDELTPKKLLDMFNQWGINKDKIYITEKPDGRFMRFGIENGKFFVRSKNKTFHDLSEYPNLFFYEDFVKYHKDLEKVNLKNIVQETLSKNTDNILIVGEAIASYDSNVVLYDKNVVGNGLFVVFDIQIDGKSIDDIIQKKIITEINKQSTIKFYSKLLVDVSDFDVQKYSLELEDLIKQYGNVLNKQARTEQDKKIKNEILDKVKQFSLKFKSDFVSNLKDYNPYFGNEYEGFVVHLPDGKEYKIVDKNKFTQRKMSNWHYMELINKYSNEFKNKIKTEAIAHNVDNLNNQMEILYDDFKINSDKFIDIPGRKRDTINQFKLTFNIIKKIRNLSKTQPEDTIRKNILNKTLEESKLTEGGHSFENVTPIKNEYMKNSLVHLFKNVNMPDVNYKMIGNYRKPIMNDVDIALDKQSVANIIHSNNVSDKGKFFDDLNLYVKKNRNMVEVPSYKINKGLQQMSTLSRIIDSDGNNSEQFFQTDFMIGDVSWMTPTLGPADSDSKYKAAHRNFLYTAALSQIIKNTNDPDIKQKYQLNMKNGIELVTFKYENGKRIKLGVEPYTKDLTKFMRLLFKSNIQYKDVNSFEKLYNEMKSNNFKYPQLLPGIVEEFKKTTNASKLPIPSELNDRPNIISESGIQNINKLSEKFKYFEIFYHEDADGIFSAISIKKYLEKYGLTFKQSFPINYGKKEYEIPKTSDDSDTMSVLVDFAHGKIGFEIHLDHHDSQIGVEKGTSIQFRHAKSNTETISDIISPVDIFPASDIKYINMIDNAEFFNNKVSVKQTTSSVFKKGKDTDESKKNMILVINRLLLVYKNKENFMNNIIKDSNSSLYNIFLNCIKYSKQFNTLNSLDKNSEDYYKLLKKDDTVIYKNEIIINKFDVSKTKGVGAYNRYSIFRVYPKSKFLINIMNMQLQISKNPFIEKSNVNLGKESDIIFEKTKPILNGIITSIRMIKALAAHNATKEQMDFKFDDLINTYGFETKNLDVQTVGKIKHLMDSPYRTYSDENKEFLDTYSINTFDIIKKSSGGHPDITNVSGLNYIGDNEIRKKFIKEYVKEMIKVLEKLK